MKILYLNYYSLPQLTSGREKIEQFGFSYRFLSKFDASFEIVVIDCIGDDDDFIEGNVQYRFRKKLSNTRFKGFTRINKEIVKLNPDVILLQGFRFVHYAAAVKKKLPNTRLIVQHHAEQVPLSWVKQKILKHYNRNIDAYIFSARELAASWMKKGIIDKNKSIIELPEIATDFKRGNLEKIPNSFIWVGRLDDNKDPLTVISGIAPYFVKHSDAKLKMYYHIDSLKEAIIQKVEALGIVSQVELMGKIPNEEIEAEYQKSQFFLLGSHYEGGSLALMESLACGCIPIVSDIPANRKFTNEGKLGVLFAAGSSESLSEGMNQLDTLQSEEHTKKIRAYFEESLSAEAIAKGVLNHLKI